jgi:hypothetical protein
VLNINIADGLSGHEDDAYLSTPPAAGMASPSAATGVFICQALSASPQRPRSVAVFSFRLPRRLGGSATGFARKTHGASIRDTNELQSLLCNTSKM